MRSLGVLRAAQACVGALLLAVSLSHAGAYDDFFAAIANNRPAVVQDLLARGMDPNSVNPQGQHSLMLALRAEAYPVAALLLEQPKIRVEVRNAFDESPLMLAALKGQLALCQRLVALDADINKPGWTPLHYAASTGQVAVVQWLLEQHAYLDAESPNASTPLMLAAMYGTSATVRVLLEAGADPTLKNQRGLDAQDFARQVQRSEVAQMIADAVRVWRSNASDRSASGNADADASGNADASSNADASNKGKGAAPQQ